MSAQISALEAIMKRFDSADPDQRFMALEDFKNQSQTAQRGFTLAMTTRVVSKVLELGQDSNSDVCNAALESLGVIAAQAQAQQINFLLDDLLSLRSTDRDELLDPRTMALRNVLANMKDGAEVTNGAVSKLLGVVRHRIGSHHTERHILFDLEPLTICFKLLPISCISCKTVVSELIPIMGDLLFSPFANNVVRKRDVQCLSVVTQFRQDDLTKQILSLIDRFLSSKPALLEDTCRLLIAAISAVSDRLSSGYFESWFQRLIDIDIDDGIDVYELAMLSLDQMLQHHVKVAPELLIRLTDKIAAGVRYDPNLLTEDDEDDDMGMDQSDDDENFFAEDDEISDDEDTSWKVRKVSIIVASTLLQKHRTDALRASTQINALIDCVSDRDEAVCLEALVALSSLVQDQTFFRSRPNSPSLSPQLKRKRNSTLSSHGIMHDQSDTIHWQRLATKLQKAMSARSVAKKVEILKTTCNLSGILLQDGKTFAWFWNLLSRSNTAPSSMQGRALNTVGLETQVLSLARIIIKKAFMQSDSNLASTVISQLTGFARSQSTRIIRDTFEVLQLLVRRCRDMLINPPSVELNNALQIAEQYVRQDSVDITVKEAAIALFCTVASLSRENIGNDKQRLMTLATGFLKTKQLQVVVLEGLKEVILQQRDAPEWISGVTSDLLTGLDSEIAPIRKASTDLFIAFFETHKDYRLKDSDIASLRQIALGSLTRVDTVAATSMIRMIGLSMSINPLPIADFDHVVARSVRHTSDTSYTRFVCDICYRLLVLSPDMWLTLDRKLSSVLGDANSHKIDDSKISELEDFKILLLSSGLSALASQGKFSIDEYIKDATSLGMSSVSRRTALWAIARCDSHIEIDDASRGFALLRTWASENGLVDQDRFAVSAALGRLAVSFPSEMLRILSPFEQENDTIGEKTLSVASMVTACKAIALSYESTQKIYQILVSCNSSYPPMVRQAVAWALQRLIAQIPDVMSLLKNTLQSSRESEKETLWTGLQSLHENTSGVSNEALSPIVSMVFESMSTDEPRSRIALLATQSFIHCRPLLASTFSKAVTKFISATLEVDASLIRVVEMGPFKHKIDDGIVVRKLSYDCLLALLIQAVKIDEPEELFVSHLKGMSDAADIKLVTYLCLVQWARKYSTIFTNHLDAVVTLWRKNLTISTVSDVPNAAENDSEMVKAALRCVAEIAKSSIDQTPEFKLLLLDLQSGPKSQEFQSLMAA